MPWVAAVWGPHEAAIAALPKVELRRALPDQGRYAAGAPFDLLIHCAGPVPNGLVALGEKVWAGEVETVRPRIGTDECAVTLVALMRRAPALTAEEFAVHWREHHAPLALRHHEGLHDYAQHLVVRELVRLDSEPVDGVAELGFVTRADLETRFYDSDEGRTAIGVDVRRFMAGPGPDSTLLGPPGAEKRSG